MRNEQIGKQFEELFSKQCRWNGFLPIRNYLSCRFLFKGRVQVIKSQLDFTVVSKEGRVACVDCKSFQHDFFTWAQIPIEQIERAQTLNEWNVPSGFVVLFRPSLQVVFYSGVCLNLRGQRTRFTPDMGLRLGRFDCFSPRPIFLAQL
jgi:hypothetical protein